MQFLPLYYAVVYCCEYGRICLRIVHILYTIALKTAVFNCIWGVMPGNKHSLSGAESAGLRQLSYAASIFLSITICGIESRNNASCFAVHIQQVSGSGISCLKQLFFTAITIFLQQKI